MSIPKPRTGGFKARNLGVQPSMRKLIDSLPKPLAPKVVCDCDCHLTTPHANPHARDRCHCKPPRVRYVS